MFKFFGREDTVRDEEVFDGNTKYSNIELYTTKDIRTGQDIGRPINNIYQNQYKIISFLEEFIKAENEHEGVFPGSLKNEYQITADDIVQVTVDSNVKNFIRVPPGAAAVSYIDTESEEHTKPLILINTPAVDIAARQIAKILSMDLSLGRENVIIKYLYGNDSFKAKITIVDTTTRLLNDYYFGCADEAEWLNDTLSGKNTGIELLTDIYNEADFTYWFEQSLSGDLTKITLEPAFEISAVDLYYIYYDLTDGEMKINTALPPSNFFNIAGVDITDVSVGSLSGTPNNTHVLFNDKKILNITGVDNDSLKITTAGGVEINASGVADDSLKITTGGGVELNASGTSNDSLKITTDGGVELNASGTADDSLKITMGGGIEINASGAATDSLKITTAGGIEINATSAFDINTSVNISGDLVVTGDVTSRDELVVSDNIITLNDGETGAGVTAGTAGLTIDRGIEPNYRIIFDEATDNFKVGEENSEQPVATREETPTDGVGVVWNAANNRFESEPGLSGFTPVSEFAYDSQTDFDWSVRDIGTNPVTSSAEGINTNRQDLYEFVELLSTEGAGYQVAAGASLIGADGIAGVTPSAKNSGEPGNLQQVLEGLLNPNTTILTFKRDSGLDSTSFTSASWNKVNFIVEEKNEIKNCSLSSAEITVDAGTYEIEAFSAGYQTGLQKLRVTDGTSTLLSGINSATTTSGTEVINSVVSGYITFITTTTFWVEHYSESGGKNGRPLNIGEDEIYAQIKIVRRG